MGSEVAYGMRYAGANLLDPNYRRFRRVTVPNAVTVTHFWTCSHFSLFCNVWNSVFCLPAFQLDFEFRFTDLQRPRYYYHPRAVRLPSVGGGGAGNEFDFGYIPAQQLPPANDWNIYPDKVQSYVMYQTVRLRSDLEQAYKQAFQLSMGTIIQFLYTYDLKQTTIPINSTSYDFENIIGRGNMPYKTIYGIKPSLPINNLPAGWVTPVKWQMSPFAFGYCNMSRMQTIITEPTKREYVREFRPEPPLCYTPDWQWDNQTEWGYLNHQYYIQEKNHMQGSFREPDFNDLDSMSPMELWEVAGMPPHGCVFHPANICNQGGQGAPPVANFPDGTGPPVATPQVPLKMLGAHSFRFADNVVCNRGPHNQFNSFLWQACGYDDNGTDFGIFFGTLRTHIDFRDQIPTPLIIYGMNKYLITIGYNYNGTGQTDLLL